MYRNIFAIVAFVVFLAGCSKKTEQTIIKTTPGNPFATFSIKDKNTFYLTEPVNVTADYTEGGTTGYKWDWGDGTVTNEGETAKHSYPVKGSYTITMTVGSATSSKNIRVHPGMASFQIVNGSNFILTNVHCRRAVDATNYDEIIAFDTLPKTLSDTIYTSTSLTDNLTLKVLDVYGDCGANADSYAFFQLVQPLVLEPYKHGVLTLNNSYPVYYRNAATNQLVVTTLDKYEGYAK